MQLIPILPLSPSAKLLNMPSLYLPSLTAGKLYLVLTLYLVVTNVTGSSSPNDAFINSASIASSSLSSDSSSSSIPSSLLTSSSSSSLTSSSESSPMVQFNSPVAALTSSVSSSSSGIRNSNINKRSASPGSSDRSTSNTGLFKGDAIIESETLTPGTSSMSVFEGEAIILICKVKSNESESVNIEWQVQPEDLSDEPVNLKDFGIDANTTEPVVSFPDGDHNTAVLGSGSVTNSGNVNSGSDQQQQSRLKITEVKLYIKSATYSHRAHYYCQISRNSPIGQPLRVLVRVKDRLAALWPFLGIVGEVVILCTVIFIYESKRTKAEEEDLDDTTSASSPTRHAGTSGK